MSGSDIFKTKLSAIMALAELCGLDTQFKFNLRKNVLPMESDVIQYTGNMYDNCQLAMPPYLNVSPMLS